MERFVRTALVGVQSFALLEIGSLNLLLSRVARNAQGLERIHQSFSHRRAGCSDDTLLVLLSKTTLLFLYCFMLSGTLCLTSVVVVLVFAVKHGREAPLAKAFPLSMSIIIRRFPSLCPSSS